MTKRRAQLQVEELGQRVLPSASPLHLDLSALAALHTPHHAAPAPALHGNGVAVYTSTMSIPDTGTAYQFNGAGSFGSVGFATISGEIHTVGFILNGHATGTLTLTNAQGSVTLELTGPAQSSFAPLPHQFQYQVVSGTGAFANLHDHGTLHLQSFGTTATPGAPGYGVFVIRI